MSAHARAATVTHLCEMRAARPPRTFVIMSATTTNARDRLLARLGRAQVSLTVHVTSVARLAEEDAAIAKPLRAVTRMRDALSAVYFFALDDAREEALRDQTALTRAMLSIHASCTQSLVAMRQCAFAKEDASRVILLDARLAACTMSIDEDAVRAEIAALDAPLVHFARAAIDLLARAAEFPQALRV